MPGKIMSSKSAGRLLKRLSEHWGFIASSFQSKCQRRFFSLTHLKLLENSTCDAKLNECRQEIDQKPKITLVTVSEFSCKDLKDTRKTE